MSLIPPLVAQHGHFRPDLPRSFIREHKLPCSPQRFFSRYWGTKDCYLTFGDGMGFSKMVVGDWSLSEDSGYLQRTCSWIIPVGTFAVGGITPVNQVQKVRFQEKSVLIIELSTSTPDVPFGNAFTIEQQYEIHEVGNDNLHLKTSCGIYWMSNPWGSSMVSGTIESRSFEETTKSTCHLLALIEQDLKALEQPAQEPTQPKRVEQEKRRGKKPTRDSKSEKNEKIEKNERIEKSEKTNDTKPRRLKKERSGGSGEKREFSQEKDIKSDTMGKDSTSFSHASAEPSFTFANRISLTASEEPILTISVDKNILTEPTPFKPISLPRASDLPRDKQASNPLIKVMAIFKQLISKCFDLLKTFLGSDTFQIVCLILLSIMVVVLYSRVMSLESQVANQIDNDSLKKVQFLQKFIKDLAINITKDPNIMETHLAAWRSNRYLEIALADWQKQVLNLLKNIRQQNDLSSSKAIDFTQDLLRKLDEHTLFMEKIMPYDTWAAWLFYWCCVLSVIAGSIAVIIFYIPKPNANKEKTE